MDDESDIDLAVEFDEIRPEDDGYSDVYFGLRSDLNDAFTFPVDIIGVHSMSPRFAHTAFKSGMIIVGSETRHEELASTLAGESISVADARNRVAAAAKRLKGKQ